jgi:signal transduction histidine kinase
MKLVFEKVNIRNTVEKASQVVAPLLAPKQFVQYNTVIAQDVPESITSDRIKLKQILVNFLSNTVKFTKKGNITLKVKCTPIQDILTNLENSHALVRSWANAVKFVKFSVKDTGIGVNPKDFETVFSAFEQVRKLLIRIIS